MPKRRFWLTMIATLAFGLTGLWFVHAWTGPARATATVISSASPSDDADPAIAVPDDAECRQLLADANAGEALAWLTDPRPNRAVAQWDRRQAVDLIRGFYGAGAEKIDVVDTETIGGIEVASQFVITLPADLASRARIFQKDAEFESQYQSDPANDIGQKYLHLTTD